MTDKEELTKGEALARVAVLEAEVAELRKRVCVPEGWVVVPSQCTPQMEDAYDQQCADDNAYGCSMHLPAYEAMLTAAPAPVERVGQDHDAIALEKARNIMQIMYGEMPKGGSTQLLAQVQVRILEAMNLAASPAPATVNESLTPEMIDRGVAFALSVSLSGEYGWSEYVRDIYLRMQSASPHATQMSMPQPTAAMVEAAEYAYMPMGDMWFALMAAYHASLDKTDSPYQPTPDVAGLVEALEQGFPLFGDEGLDEVVHHCEWAIQQDRKRLHALIAAHQQREGV